MTQAKLGNVIEINGRKIGPGHPVYLVAELSCNHGGSFEKALSLIQAAKESGADAVKLQTFTPDTITMDSGNECFQVNGRSLYDLYKEIHTPWEWYPKLKAAADELALAFFSAAFDPTSVDFLKELGVPAYKLASCEITDIPLIEKIASTGKPLLMSTGMAEANDIKEAVEAFRRAGGRQLALLKCASAYPAAPEEMNLRTIPHMAAIFGVPIGLSDHTKGTTVPVAAVPLGACIIEKHFTLSRNDPGPESTFSLEPSEFLAMARAVRSVEKALGKIQYGAVGNEKGSLPFRRSLFVARDIKKGEIFTNDTVRSIRPANGLPPRHLKDILGKKAKCDIPRATPLQWEHLSN